jgi:hypothetical protein
MTTVTDADHHDVCPCGQGASIESHTAQYGAFAVKLVHVPGDRRDHFESMRDVWSIECGLLVSLIVIAVVGALVSLGCPLPATGSHALLDDPVDSALRSG